LQLFYIMPELVSVTDFVVHLVLLYVLFG